MFLVIGRTIKESIINFWRNGWLSIAVVSVLTLSLFVVGAVFLLIMAGDNMLKNIENKMNVSVYFKADIEESKIFEIRDNLKKYSEIKSIEYISKDQALENFKKNNENEPVIMQALEEIGENPLLASLVVVAHNSSQYQYIVDYINSAEFKGDIGRINYDKNKTIIEKLNNVINQVKKNGIILAGIFGVVSILIIFNTIRITIYTHKNEIEVMRLVGASNMFIRLPFVFEGIIYGIISSLVASAFLLLATKLISSYALSVISGGNMFDFYLEKALLILGAQATIGVFLGILGSWIAMRKYLKI